MEQPYLSSIRIYPIKSLDYVELQETEIGVHALRHDRNFAMITEDGKFVNGKRTGLVNQLQARYDIAQGLVYLSKRGLLKEEEFELREGNDLLNHYLSDFFNMTIKLIHRTKGELQDMPQVSSVSVVSENTFKSLHQAFPNESLEQFRMRFRTNLEIGGVEAFWEESLFDKNHRGLRFKIGEVVFHASAPRARCNVPPKDPFSGELDKNFAHCMIKQRERTLPDNSHLPYFGNLYHLTLDTFLEEIEKGKAIRLGDRLDLLG